MYHVDARWVGHFGIGRFAHEVLSRLPADVTPARLRGSPSSPLDALNPTRALLGAGPLLYTPGFNAGVSAATQVLTVHDLIHLHDPGARSRPKSFYYEAVVRPAVLRAGTVLTVSEASRDAIREWLSPHADEVDVRVVGNGASAPFVPGPADTPEVGRFCWVGNLKPHKNVEVVLSALRRRSGYRLVMVTADADAALRAARQQGVADRVEVRSAIGDSALAELYRTSTALLLPSRREGFGLPALEAMSCGTRVAYDARCAAVAEVVAGRGLPVDEARSPDGWVDAMDAAVSGVGVPLALPSGWREGHGWQGVAERVDAGVRSVVRRRSRPTYGAPTSGRDGR